ncbi:MAG TPA: ThiF family adenylyltransferase [Anaerolineaceae bacterium]|jgi:molybdopterin/thiamine biosynthesis adenylyltransferase|nr:ThiF family adenylyltransferase [Anaerolineales bacterium]HOG58685.1 ThiF family adenylyltransferase [Anaerolineaceae bacterium]HOR84838.1 ThiF family adenylyltransferase [Anaerolineaceae bacterium]HPL43453.1 ThiF family adenylyltransferase [Anaerolineaceae bacterium]HPY32660.1 ThiF family adenylyltransferase [Anaerolineaceae bacterium]
MQPGRYLRNALAISPKEQERLSDCRALVVGCGGLGGFVLEYLGRLGVGNLRAVDPDTFSEGNLNRQLLSSSMNLGRPKALAAAQRMQAVNPLARVEGVQAFLTEENAAELLEGCQVALDCLDSIPARRTLQHACARAGVPLVHAAIGGWLGQVCVILPGERLLDQIYPDASAEHGEEYEQGALAFTAGMTAAAQAAEAVKLLLDKPGLRGELLVLDLLNGSFERLRLVKG